MYICFPFTWKNLSAEADGCTYKQFLPNILESIPLPILRCGYLLLLVRWKITVWPSIPSAYSFTAMLPTFLSLCHLFMSLPFCFLYLGCPCPHLQQDFRLSLPQTAWHCSFPLHTPIQSHGWQEP